MSRLSEEDAALEAALWAEMADPEPPPVPAVPPPAKVRRVTKRSRPLPETGGDGGLGALVNAASVRPNAAATAAMPAADDGDEGNDAAGYIWGMNIVTGKSREEEEAEAAAAAAHASSARGGETDGAGEPSKRSQALVQLRYGTYQGLELSANEVRRIKAEECRAMLSRRKLVRTHATHATQAHACHAGARTRTRRRMHSDTHTHTRSHTHMHTHTHTHTTRPAF